MNTITETILTVAGIIVVIILLGGLTAYYRRKHAPTDDLV